MSTKKPHQSIAARLEQLENLLAWFESDEITIEESVHKYEAALKLSQEIEDELRKAKNTIEVLKKNFVQ